MPVPSPAANTPGSLVSSARERTGSQPPRSGSKACAHPSSLVSSTEGVSPKPTTSVSTSTRRARAVEPPRRVDPRERYRPHLAIALSRDHRLARAVRRARPEQGGPVRGPEPQDRRCGRQPGGLRPGPPVDRRRLGHRFDPHSRAHQARRDHEQKRPVADHRRPRPRHHALALDEVLHAPGGDDAGQRPAGERHWPVIGSGREDDAPGPHAPRVRGRRVGERQRLGRVPHHRIRQVGHARAVEGPEQLVGARPVHCGTARASAAGTSPGAVGSTARPAARCRRARPPTARGRPPPPPPPAPPARRRRRRGHARSRRRRHPAARAALGLDLHARRRRRRAGAHVRPPVPRP